MPEETTSALDPEFVDDQTAGLLSNGVDHLHLGDALSS